MACEKFFLKRLQECGFRLTPQREMVLAVLHRQAGFVTAETIYNQVLAISAAVNISTVYRTLELLEDFGLVAAIDAGEGQRQYGLLDVEAPHLHLLCSRCGRIEAVDLGRFETLMTRVAEQYGFKIDADQVCLAGLCQDCRAAPGEAGAAHNRVIVHVNRKSGKTIV